MGYGPPQAVPYGYGPGMAPPGVQAAGYGYPTFAPAVAPAMMPPPPMMDGPMSDDGAVGCEACCKPRLWASAGYMMTWLRSDHLPLPLLTVGRATDIPPGALGQGGTGILVNDKTDYDMFSGVRAEVGVFLDEGRCFSLELAGQFWASNTQHAAQSSDVMGNPILARPIFDVSTGMSSALPTSIPNVFAGAASVDARAEILGSELNARWHTYTCPQFQADVLVGFRYFHLGESLAIREGLTPLFAGALSFQGTPVPVPSVVAVLDQFKTRNDFYGLQLGGQCRFDCEWLFFSPYAKCAIGGTQQTVDIHGTTGLITPTSFTVANGGVLALPSNSGHYTRSVLSVLPEGGLTFGVKICKGVELTAGYSFLLLSGVVRPGRQIDPGVNLSQVPSSVAFGTTSTAPSRPVFLINNEVVWMNNLTLGLNFRY
jgi:hypothetical protein